MTITEKIEQFLNTKDCTSYLYKAYLLDNGDESKHAEELNSKKSNQESLYLHNTNILDFEYNGNEWEFVPNDMEDGITFGAMQEITSFMFLLNKLYNEGNKPSL
jgi:hypothetical protein